MQNQTPFVARRHAAWHLQPLGAGLSLPDARKAPADDRIVLIEQCCRISSCIEQALHSKFS